MQHSSIAYNHFSTRTLKALTRRGIFVLGIQGAPDFDGDQYFSATLYSLSNNGQGQLRTHAEVLKLAIN